MKFSLKYKKLVVFLCSLLVIFGIFGIINESISSLSAFTENISVITYLSPLLRQQDAANVPEELEQLYSPYEYSNTAGSLTAYRLECYNGLGLDKFNRIKITFPKDTSLDELYTQLVGKEIKCGEYEIEKQYLASKKSLIKVIIYDDNKENTTFKILTLTSAYVGIDKITENVYVDISLFNNVLLNNSNKLVIFIDKKIGIMNPTIDRPCYQIGISFYKNGISIEQTSTDQYTITVSKIYDVQAKVDPDYAGMESEGKVFFVTGPRGNLNANVDAVNLEFSNGFILRSPTFRAYSSPDYTDINLSDLSAVSEDNENLKVKTCSGRFNISDSIVYAKPVFPLGKLSTLTPLFGWIPVPEAQRYEIRIESIGGMLICDDNNVTESFFKLPNSVHLRDHGEFMWKVRACVNNAWTEWSSYNKFEINLEDPNFYISVDKIDPLIVNQGDKKDLYFHIVSNNIKNGNIRLSVLNNIKDVSINLDTNNIQVKNFVDKTVLLQVSVGKNAYLGKHSIFVKAVYTDRNGHVIRKTVGFEIFVKPADNNTVIYLPNMQEVRGEYVLVPLRIINNQKNIKEFEFDFKYSPLVLTFVGAYMPDSGKDTTIYVKGNTVYCTSKSGFGKRENGDILLYLKFYVGILPQPSNKILNFLSLWDLAMWKQIPIAATYRSGNSLSVYFSSDIPALKGFLFVFDKGSIINSSMAEVNNYVSISTSSEQAPVFANIHISPREIKDLTATIKDPYLNDVSGCDLHFKTSGIGDLSAGKNIYIQFPTEFSFKQRRFNVQINGKNAGATAVFGNKGWLVDVKVPFNLVSNEDVRISFPPVIENPSSQGKYEIKVWDDKDNTPAFCYVDIIYSHITNLSVVLSDYGQGDNSDFYINFNTGSGGALSKSDKIFIKLPGFYVPNKYLPGSLIINDIPLNKVVTNSVYQRIEITVPMDIYGQDPVKVNISKDFGIKNPALPGEYFIKVSTSKEPLWMKSNLLKIVLLPTVGFKINPKQPNDKGFYNTLPNVRLFTPNGEKIYYKLDAENFVLYKNDYIVIPEGKHKLYAYAVDKYGNKGKIEERDFDVDITPPKIIFDQGEDDLYVNSTHPTITGKVSEPCVLQINGVPATVNSDLAFSVQLDVTNGAPLAIYARDLAGNSISLLRTIYVDTAPPIITLISPDKEEFSTTEPNFVVKVSLNEKGEVTLNGTNMSFENGVFTESVQLTKGENNFTIVARDIAGNEAVKKIKINLTDQIIIKLQIGNDKAYIGDQETGLDSPPVIIKNKTFVPLRFISEAFGAEIQWNGALKVIMINYQFHSIQLQVGSTDVLVDGTIKKLVAPPVIKNNRTLVPLRFIAETFGAEVNWDGKTKSIEIAYTPMP